MNHNTLVGRILRILTMTITLAISLAGGIYLISIGIVDGGILMLSLIVPLAGIVRFNRSATPDDKANLNKWWLWKRTLPAMFYLVTVGGTLFFIKDAADRLPMSIFETESFHLLMNGLGTLAVIGVLIGVGIVRYFTLPDPRQD